MRFSTKFFVLAAILPAMLWSCKEKYEEQDWAEPKEGHINVSCTASAFGETMIWPDGAKIGLYCEQANAVNVPVNISAASAGGESGEFYSTVAWGEGTHTVYIYYPYREDAVSEEFSIELPSTWSQSGQTYSHLMSRNLFHTSIETEPAEGSNVLAATLEPIFSLAEIKVSGSKYEGYNLDRISISAKDGSALSGKYKFNIATGALTLEGGGTVEDSAPLTLNASGIQIGSEPVSLWYLTGAADDKSVTCDFVVTLSNDRGSIELTGEDDLTMETVLSVDSFSSSVIEDDSIDLSDPDGDGARETANCYVVGKAGQTYRFPATIMGNGYTTPADPSYDAGSAPGITPSVMAPASAKVLWQTAKDLITNVKLQNDHVYFDLPGDNGTFVPGNAVIAIYNGSGRILWSWHIWVTDADLEANLQTWKVHEDLAAYEAYQDPQLMDRNLGALSNLDWASSNTNAAKGLFYQWGRKDPFIGPDNSGFKSRVAMPTYDSEGNLCDVYPPVATTPDFTNDARWTHVNKQLSRTDIAAYPMAFVSGASTSAETAFWLEETAHDLWGLPALGEEANTIGHKTIYDPCPPGYRVMNPYAMTGVMSSMNGGKYEDLGNGNVVNPKNYGETDLQVKYDGTNIATLPPCGLIYFEKGDKFYPFDRTGTYCYMWTSSISDGKRGMRMHYDINNFVAQEPAYASYGHGVRCEKIK